MSQEGVFGLGGHPSPNVALTKITLYRENYYV